MIFLEKLLTKIRKNICIASKQLLHENELFNKTVRLSIFVVLTQIKKSSYKYHIKNKVVSYNHLTDFYFKKIKSARTACITLMPTF